MAIHLIFGVSDVINWSKVAVEITQDLVTCGSVDLGYTILLVGMKYQGHQDTPDDHVQNPFL